MLRRNLIVAQALCLVAISTVAAEEIDEIFVTAARRAVDSDQLSIAVATAEGESVRGQKLVTDALAATVGVIAQQTTPGQGAAIVRGQKGSAVLHLVDGMRLNNAIFRSAPTQYFALVPTLAVERVEILRGTPTSLYGSDAIGGVLQVITRAPEFELPNPRGEILVSGNTAESAQIIGATIEAGADRVATSLSAEYADVGNRRTGRGKTIKPSAYTSRAVRWVLALKPDRNSKLSLDAQYVEQPKTPRTDELVPGFGQTQPSSSEFWFRPNTRLFLHADYERRAGWLDLDWNIDLAWQRIDDDRVSRDYLAPQRVYEDNRSDLAGLTVSGSRQTDRGSWIAGVDIYHDDVSSRRDSEDVAGGQRTNVAPRFPDGSSMQLVSAYANNTWQVGERHALTLGGRLSDVRTRVPGASIDNTELSGDLGWVATIDARWQFVSNLGFGFRAPNVFDVGSLGNRPGNRFNIPNTDLDAERVVHGDVGLRYRSPTTRFEVVMFAMQYQDRITSVTTGDVTPDGRDVTQSVNAAETTVHGAEASLAAAFAENWTIIANATYTWGEQQIRGRGREAGDRIPPLNGIVQVEFDPGRKWQADVWLRFAAEQSRLSGRDRGDTRIDPDGTSGWVSAGARASWQPNASWTLMLEVANAFDAAYRIHGSGIDTVGRNFVMSVRRRF